MSNRRPSTKSGFTIVELSLAVAFIAVLMITIAIITINITSIYQKGLSIKSINATGRDLIDDFSRAIAASPNVEWADLCANLPTARRQEKCRNDNAQQLIFQSYSKGVLIPNPVTGRTTSKNVQTSGFFCTGRYSYVWNTGYALSPDGKYGTPPKAIKIKYQVSNNAATSTSDFRLLKFEDPDRIICASYAYDTQPATYDFTTAAFSSAPEELLADADLQLALFELNITPVEQNNTTLQAFYSGDFTLATLKGSVEINDNGGSCKDDPSLDDLNSDFAYCAINKFNFATRSAGGV